MPKAFSTYLDLMRLCAALVVFIAHLSSAELTEGKLWQLKAYDQLAVMVFFVMSGYVIAYATDRKSADATSYFIARFSRIYSVLLPALALTAVCDSLGLSISPALYHESAWEYPEGTQWMHYVLSVFLLQNVWDLQMNPGINGPLWSLTFEWFYYLIFGAAFFLTGRTRAFALFFLALLAGPTIIAMAPIWWMGVLIYRMHQYPANRQQWTLWLCVASAALLCVLPPMLHAQLLEIPGIARKNLAADYLWALLFSLHLWTLPNLLHRMTRFSAWLCRHNMLIQSIAIYTFALYLFHRPIIQLMGAIWAPDLGGWAYYLLQWGVTIGATWFLGHYCELLKRALSSYLHQRRIMAYSPTS